MHAVKVLPKKGTKFKVIFYIEYFSKLKFILFNYLEKFKYYPVFYISQDTF